MAATLAINEAMPLQRAMRAALHAVGLSSAIAVQAASDAASAPIFVASSASTAPVLREPVAILRAATASMPRMFGSSSAQMGEVADVVGWAQRADFSTAKGSAAALADVGTRLAEGRSYLAGHSLTIADPLVLSLLTDAAQPPAGGAAALSAAAQAGLWASHPAVARWCDQLRHEPGLNFGEAGAALALSARPALDTFGIGGAAGAAGAAGGKKKAAAEAAEAAPAPAPAPAAAAAAAAPAPAAGGKAGKGGAGAAPSKPAGGAGGGGDAAAAAAGSKDVDDPVSACNFLVGTIVDCWKHPESDKLWCEKIEVGEASGPREIASGLQQVFTLEQMKGQRVVIIANLQARKLAGFASNGMVLCATGPDGTIEFVEPPAGAKDGERVVFAGHEGPAVEPNRMAKKKLWEAVSPDLQVDAERRATWKGVAFGTSAGPCTVKSVPAGSLIK